MKLIKWAEHNFWAFFALGIALGLFLPAQMEYLEPVALPALAAVLFLTFLKVDIEQMRSLRGELPRLMIIGGIRFLIVPLAALVLLMPMLPEYAMGVALLLAVPAGLSTPALSDIFGGAVAASLLFSVVSHVLSPISVPLAILLSGAEATVPIFVIARVLALLALLPFVLAQLVRWKARSVVTEVNKRSIAASLVLLVVVIAGLIAPHSETLLGSLSTAPLLVLLVFGVSIALHIIGLLLGIWSPREEKVSIMLASAYNSVALSIALASEFFHCTEVLVTVFYLLAWNIMIIPFGIIVKKWLGNS